MHKVSIPRMIGDASSTPSTLTDGALLQRVGSRRDRDAFNELFKRNERTLYNLAYQFTNHRERAEDVVQDAAVRIWRSASTFREDGNARAWMLRIVARVSVARLSRMRTHRSLAGLDQLPQDSETAPGPTDMAEEAEVLALLRDALQRLSLLERRMVVLHFCAGMTQQEVGEALGVPQRTVSNRLKGALASLRSGLVNAKPTSAAALLAGERLGMAILSQEPVPGGLRERVLERVSQLDGASPGGHPFSAGRTAQSGGLALVAASLAAVGMVSGPVWFAAGSKSGAPHTSTPAPAEAPRVLPAPGALAGRGAGLQNRPENPAAAGVPGLFWTEDFNRAVELPRPLKPLGGAWRVLPGGGPDGSNCLEIKPAGVSELGDRQFGYAADGGLALFGRRVSCAVIEVPVQSLPVVVSYRATAISDKSEENCMVTAAWRRIYSIAQLNGLAPTNRIPVGQWQEWRVYVTDKTIDRWCNDRPNALVITERAPDSTLCLLVIGSHWRVDDLQIRSIKPEEVPDTKAAAAAWEARNGPIKPLRFRETDKTVSD